MIWSLCLLCMITALRAVHAGPIRDASKMTNTGAAPQEEVNVLMFGVIQFSESLNYVYETTEAKIAKINQTLENHEGTLQRLREQTELAADVEKQIKELIQLLQVQMVKQQAQTKLTKDKLTSMEEEELELKMKVKRLEMYLSNSAPNSIQELQDRAEEHSNVLLGLQHLTQFQKENIEIQREQLSKLQRMSEAMP